jgi:hypothetical protein
MVNDKCLNAIAKPPVMAALPASNPNPLPSDALLIWTNSLGFATPGQVDLDPSSILSGHVGFAAVSRRTGASLTVFMNGKMAIERDERVGKAVERMDWTVANPSGGVVGWVESMIARRDATTLASSIALFDATWNQLASIDFGTTHSADGSYEMDQDQLNATHESWLAGPDGKHISRIHYADCPLETPKGTLPPEDPPSHFMHAHPYLVLTMDGDVWARLIPRKPDTWTLFPALDSMPGAFPFVHALLTACQISIHEPLPMGSGPVP